MDRTDLFKSTIRAIRQKRRTLSQDGGTEPSLLLSSKVKNSPTPFNMLSKNTVDHVTQLRDFLLKHRRDYIDTSGTLSRYRDELNCKPFGKVTRYLSIDGMSMSDMERDMIDNGAQELIKESSDLINKLKNTTATPADEANSVGEQSKLHRMRVIESLQNYLRDVCKLYSEQKAIRIRRMVDMKNVSRLQPDGMVKPTVIGNDRHVGLEEPSPDVTRDNPSGSLDINLPPKRDFFNFETFEKTLSPEEMSTFQQENVLMVEHMNSLVDEVKQIEGKVLAISKLQETFTQNVLEQAEEIDMIHQLTVTSTENIKGGNEEIRSAIRNQGSLRMWILFLLIVCSFTLLFLDWYT